VILMMSAANVGLAENPMDPDGVIVAVTDPQSGIQVQVPLSGEHRRQFGQALLGGGIEVARALPGDRPIFPSGLR
jgi:hypothetical protein